MELNRTNILKVFQHHPHLFSSSTIEFLKSSLTTKANTTLPESPSQTHLDLIWHVPFLLHSLHLGYENPQGGVSKDDHHKRFPNFIVMRGKVEAFKD